MKAMILGASVCLCGCVQLKDQDSEFYRAGPYVAGGLSYNLETFDDADDPRAEAYDSAGFGARFGYRLTPYFAADFDVQRFLGFDVELSGNSFTEERGTAFTVNFKGYAPISENVQPYGFMGGGYIKGKSRDKTGIYEDQEQEDVTLRFGVGVDAYFNQNVFMTLEASYFNPRDDLDGFDFVNVVLGIGYRF